MASVGYHEDAAALSAETRDQHRAIVSLMEELEAVVALAYRPASQPARPQARPRGRAK